MRAAYEATIRNELPYFAPVTKFPGFARATAATIGELRAAGIAAEKLETLEESGLDHAALLERFQEQMEEVLVADRTTFSRPPWKKFVPARTSRSIHCCSWMCPFTQRSKEHFSSS